MKIGIISDTHSRKAPKQMLEDFKSVDLIIHVYDIFSIEDYNFFKSFKEMKAVFGNVDSGELRKILPETIIFDVEGVSVGIWHGFGQPLKVINFVTKEFQGKKVDVAIFGHSHLPFNETIDGVLYFNPGSLTDIVRSPYCSYGIMEIKNKKITAKIIKVKN
ncbi:MAG: metallophosphoesterase family protein [Candidatus Zapsychrus exili]|nr:metallophosphoesterase family protein [Candidatus Zapsychrus exili]